MEENKEVKKGRKGGSLGGKPRRQGRKSGMEENKEVKK